MRHRAAVAAQGELAELLLHRSAGGGEVLKSTFCEVPLLAAQEAHGPLERGPGAHEVPGLDLGVAGQRPRVRPDRPGLSCSPRVRRGLLVVPEGEVGSGPTEEEIRVPRSGVEAGVGQGGAIALHRPRVVPFLKRLVTEGPQIAAQDHPLRVLLPLANGAGVVNLGFARSLRDILCGRPAILATLPSEPLEQELVTRLDPTELVGGASLVRVV